MTVTQHLDCFHSEHRNMAFMPTVAHPTWQMALRDPCKQLLTHPYGQLQVLDDASE